ncbi:hypothetical protein D1BOALGB6SA_3139 [Olavius sp. associated proteobacterium Delta 1]|nr:hypothetical protein D1BOALGB6SA_3139 [Olavius sp. associated proteobacterium Delta 1]
MNDKKLDESDIKSKEEITIDVSDTKPKTMVKGQDQAQAGSDILGSGGTGASLPAVIKMQTLAPTQKKIVDAIVIETQHKQQAEQVAAVHDFMDTNAALTFGAGPQRKYLDNLKLLLGDARIRDLQGAGSIVLEIEKGIDLAGIEALKKKIMGGGGFLSKIFGGLTNALKAFAARRQKLMTLINDIEDRIEEQMHQIMTDNARLDTMFGEVKSNFYEIGVWVYAGELALERGAKEYGKMREKVLETADPIKISETNLFREQIIALDTRLLRMKSAYVKAPITLQEVLTTQQAGRIEVQNLMDSLLFDLPAFIETINMLLALYNIKGAQEDRKRREQLAERLAELKGETLDKVAVEAKEGQVRGAKEVSLIEGQAKKIIETCKKLKDLDDKNAQIRSESETLLVDVMNDFQESMKEITEPGALPGSSG